MKRFIISTVLILSLPLLLFAADKKVFKENRLEMPPASSGFTGLSSSTFDFQNSTVYVANSTQGINPVSRFDLDDAISDIAELTLYGNTTAHPVITSNSTLSAVAPPTWYVNSTLSDGLNTIGTFWYESLTDYVRSGVYHGHFYCQKLSGTKTAKGSIELVWTNDNGTTVNSLGTSAETDAMITAVTPYSLAVSNTVDIVGNSSEIYLGVKYYLNQTGTGTNCQIQTLGGSPYATHLDTPGVGTVSGYVTPTYASNFTLLYDDPGDIFTINQTSTTGVGNVPLVFIRDYRTGGTNNDDHEASLYVLTSGTYGIYTNGYIRSESGAVEAAKLTVTADNNYVQLGAGTDMLFLWDTNSGGDDMGVWFSRRQAATDTAAIWLASDFSNANPNGDTAYDDYLSPSFVFTNTNGADAKDYAAVVMGGRTTADVTAVHYFDIFATTGASDGAADGTSTELAPAFRIGDSGASTFTNGLGPGDVLFEDDVEIDGHLYLDGGLSGQATQLHFDIDGGGSAITTGAKAWVRIPYNITAQGWDITADQAGDIVVDVWMDTYGNFPPTVADTIAGSEKPTLSSAQTNQDTSLGTWTTALVEGQYIRINVDSATTVTKVAVDIYGVRAP